MAQQGGMMSMLLAAVNLVGRCDGEARRRSIDTLWSGLGSGLLVTVWFVVVRAGPLLLVVRA